MIGIKGIGSYVPAAGRNTLDRMEQFAVTEDFLRGKTGFLKTTRMADSEDSSDLGVKAFEALREKTGLDPADVDCLVVCTQTPDGGGIPHTGGVVHKKLRLPTSCAVFDISLGCSGYVYGLSVISAFMNQNGLKNGVFITADPYSKILNEDDKNTALLFGDAATATLMTDDPVWSLGRFVFGSDGSGGDAIKVGNDGHLAMNGRSVFVFSAKVIPPMIQSLMAQEGLGERDIDYFLLHQGSRYIVDTIRGTLGIDARKAPFMASQCGNTVSSTIPLMLADKAIFASNKLVLAGFGVGLSWAGCVLSSAAGEAKPK